MNMRTKLFIGIILAAFLAVITADAQQIYNAVTLSGIPATLPSATGTNLATPPTIILGGQQNVAIQVSGTTATNGASPVQYYFQPSVDGLTWDSNRIYSITTSIPANIVNNTTVSNLNVGGWGFLRLYLVSNNAAATWTNNGVKYGLKLQAP